MEQLIGHSPGMMLVYFWKKLSTIQEHFVLKKKLVIGFEAADEVGARCRRNLENSVNFRCSNIILIYHGCHLKVLAGLFLVHALWMLGR